MAISCQKIENQMVCCNSITESCRATPVVTAPQKSAMDSFLGEVENLVAKLNEISKPSNQVISMWGGGLQVANSKLR